MEKPDIMFKDNNDNIFDPDVVLTDDEWINLPLTKQEIVSRVKSNWIRSQINKRQLLVLDTPAICPSCEKVYESVLPRYCKCGKRLFK